MSPFCVLLFTYVTFIVRYLPNTPANLAFPAIFRSLRVDTMAGTFPELRKFTRFFTVVAPAEQKREMDERERYQVKLFAEWSVTIELQYKFQRDFFFRSRRYGRKIRRIDRSGLGKWWPKNGSNCRSMRGILRASKPSVRGRSS